MLHVWRVEGVSVIEVGDDLDCYSSVALGSAIAIAENTAAKIVVNLQRCPYCDSSAVTLFIKAKKRLGERLALVVPQDAPTRRIFNITGVEAMLDILDAMPSIAEPPIAS